jgi:hypothetical protein
MTCRLILPFPDVRFLPGIQAVRDWCAPARERSWALQELSRFYRDDVTRLIAKSETLLARSRRRRISLLRDNT